MIYSIVWICHTVFIHSVDKHMVISTYWILWIKLLWKFVYTSICQNVFFPCKYLELWNAQAQYYARETWNKKKPHRIAPAGKKTYLLSFDQDGFLFRFFLRFLLGNQQAQHTVFILGLDILLGDAAAHIEAALHGARVALLADDLAFLFFL